MDKISFEITDFDVTHIIGIDLGYLVNANSEKTLNSLRGSSNWLENIKNKIISSRIYDQKGFLVPTYDTAQYNKMSESGRNTFSSYFEYNLMPLLFPFENVNSTFNYNFKIGKFKCTPTGIRLNSKGIVSIRISSRIDCENQSPEDVINEYNRYYSKIFNESIVFFNKFISLWNTIFHNFELKNISNIILEENAHEFEIFDFDYQINHDGKININELFSNEKYSEIVKQLAGLSRMSASAFKMYDVEKLNKFKKANFGNREDELWVINEERLLRYHPESKYNGVKALFEDVKLGIEILIHQEISFEYLTAWISRKRIELREKLSQNDRTVESDIDINEHILEITSISNLISDPLIIQRNVKHSFYNTVLREVIEALNLENISQTTRELFKDFFSLVSVYTSQKLTRISINLDKTNVDLSRSIKTIEVDNHKLNESIKLLTWIMIAISTIMLFISIYK